MSTTLPGQQQEEAVGNRETVDHQGDGETSDHYGEAVEHRKLNMESELMKIFSNETSNGGSPMHSRGNV